MKVILLIITYILGAGLPIIVSSNLFDLTKHKFSNPIIYLWFVMCILTGIGIGYLYKTIVKNFD